MAEFDEIGRTIEDFASEDATVVIGTSLDPDMQDEVRVTVVATGLNRGAVRQAAPRAPEKEVYRAPVKLVRNASTGQVDYDAMANVTAAPPQANGHMGLRASRSSEPASAATSALADFPTDHSYLDIPAFLRRQAD
jgi:cell division protein FtsZ